MVLTMVVNHTIRAQQQMTLRECMEYAVKNSTKKKIQEADFSDAQINRRDAILKAFTPTISAGTYAYSNFGRTVDPETNTYISTTSFNNGYSVSGSLTLFDGFAALNNIKISKTAVKMGVSEEQKVRDEICLAVMEAYYNVVFHSEMTIVLDRQVATAEENLKLVRRQHELGQKGYVDVVQTEADLAEKQSQRVKTNNLLNNAVLTLKDVMLWPVDMDLQIDKSMLTKTFASMLNDNSESAEALAEQAKTYLPSVSLAKGEMDQAKFALKTAKWQFVPTLSLSGGWSTSFYTYPGRKDYKAPPFGRQWRNNGGEYVQLSLSFPLYDRLSRHSNLVKRKNDYRRARARYEQTLHDVETEVSRALQDREGAMTAFIHARKHSEAQEESYQLNQKKMVQGMISPIEFQTISNAYLNAQAEQLNAMLQYYLKSSVVKYYKGISYLEQ